MLFRVFSPSLCVTYGRLKRELSSGDLQFTIMEILSFGRMVISLTEVIACPSAASES